MYYGNKVGFYTLGCKLNFSETSTIARALVEDGYEKVDFSEPADYYVINTCSVTENADKKCRATVRQALKRAPQAKIVVIGCYAQLKPQMIADIPGVSLVLGAQEKFNLHQHLQQLEDDTTVVKAGEIKAVDFFKAGYSFGERTRAFMKVQDGCDYFCSFCTIPLARGRSRSQSVAETIKVAEEIVASGVKEIVITGVNTGDFGKSEDGRKRTGERFIDLVKALDAIEGIDRYRISSIEPNLLTDELIEFVAQSSKFMPHFHIPLQSGSDKLLKLMRRKYDQALYTRRIEKIKQVMPNACIGVDVIVGFRGEEVTDFETTMGYLNDLDVSYLHVFTYSERTNTKALDIEPVVPVEERRTRSKMLRSLSAKKKRHFYEQHVNQTYPVLFEAEDDEGWMYGFTDNYIKVKTPYKAELVNQILPVTIGKIDSTCCAEAVFA